MPSTHANEAGSHNTTCKNSRKLNPGEQPKASCRQCSMVPPACLVCDRAFDAERAMASSTRRLLRRHSERNPINPVRALTSRIELTSFFVLTLRPFNGHARGTSPNCMRSRRGTSDGRSPAAPRCAARRAPCSVHRRSCLRAGCRWAIGEPPVKPSVQHPSALDEIERFLALVFLRRYVTYCARRRRFAQMNWAARLFAKLRAQVGTPPDR